MGKTRDLFKKIREAKGIFHAKMGTIKDRNGMEKVKEESEKAGLKLNIQKTEIMVSYPITSW